MDTLINVAHGFGVALQPINLLYCFIGVFIGTLVGVLPGIGPVSAMSLLLPVTLSGTPESGIIMMAGIYYGSMYGGSTTSILVNIPGEAASVVTCLDGHQMAKQGRAGPALGIAAFGSFIAGTFALIALMLVAPTLASVAIAFGPAEYFSLMVLGLVRPDLPDAGLDGQGAAHGLLRPGARPGRPRQHHRAAAPDLRPHGTDRRHRPRAGRDGPVRRRRSSAQHRAGDQARHHQRADHEPAAEREDWKASAGPMARGSVLGFFLGILPGGGAVIASFVSYALEKRLSKTPERFGKGAIEGVAGPEAANNAAAGGAFIPLMTLGIPPNVVMALLLGAFVMHGLQPGPLLITQNPGLFWGIVASMYIGNVMLLVLNLPLIGMWVQVLKLPYNILFPLILLFTIIGVYCSSNNVFDVYVMIAFGVIGYFMRKLGYEPAPLVLAFVLGPMLENNLRKSLILSQGDLMTFVERPISAVCLAFAVVLLIGPLLPALRRKREMVALDEGV